MLAVDFYLHAKLKVFIGSFFLLHAHLKVVQCFSYLIIRNFVDEYLLLKDEFMVAGIQLGLFHLKEYGRGGKTFFSDPPSFIEPTCAICTVGSYALLSVCLLSVCCLSSGLDQKS